MPRAGSGDCDFDIHVDPSCLSNSMDDHTPALRDETLGEEAPTPTSLDYHGPDGKTESPVAPDAAASDEKKEGDVTLADEHPEDEATPRESVQQPQDDEFELSTTDLDMSPNDQPDETADFPDSTENDSPAPENRRVSGRTDALIHAAARAVVDQIERNRHDETDEEHSVLSSNINDDYTVEGTEVSYMTETDGHRRDSHDSRGSFVSESQASRRDSDTPSLATADTHDDRAGDSSSHHEADSEVFSDRSARSSLGSFEGSLHNSVKNLDRSQLDDETLTEHTRSPRISDFSQYDPQEFVPTLRGTPRPAFRSTSDVRALQMSSPAPSVFGGSPRSAKRPHMPTISRLGSPSVSAQYSPKGRTTPSRLKPRKTTPPLVLLHATLLPLRWPWADVLEAAPSDVLSPEAKTLRDSWRRLHDRLDDTVCDRGVLLPHPQNDFEVLEERLLDALDLPLRRRARILECGHYVGPSNETTLTEDLDSDEEDEAEGRSRQSSAFLRKSLHEQTHWCGTCHHDIKFEPLGPGKIFRVKVYASNGLMKAGAWDACWKEMERVDVELEPIVETGVQDELERLAVEQREAAEAVEAAEREAAEAEEAEAALLGSAVVDGDYFDHAALPPPTLASPLPAISPEPVSPSSDTISRHDQVEERRVRDEARMREIYGATPQPAVSQAQSPEPTPDSYIPPPTPVSPSEEADARRQARRDAAPPLQNASLPELLLEAARVLLQDRKNVALVLLGLLVLFLAIQPPARDDIRMYEWDDKVPHNHAGMPEVPEIKTTPVAPAVEPVIETVAESVIEPVVESVAESATAVSSVVSEPSSVQDPCQTPSSAAADSEREAVTSREVVRIVETVTETETVKAFVTEEASPASVASLEDHQLTREGEEQQQEEEEEEEEEHDPQAQVEEAQAPEGVSSVEEALDSVFAEGETVSDPLVAPIPSSDAPEAEPLGDNDEREHELGQELEQEREL